MKEGFIMLIFQVIMDDLPPFEKYWTHMFQNNSMPVVCECCSKVFPFARLLNEIFSTEDDTNKETSAMIGEIVVTKTKALLSEIWDEKHPRRSICQVLGAKLCWDHTSDANHAADLFKVAVNCSAERHFGTTIGQIQYYGKIGLTNDLGVSQVRLNSDLSRGFDTGCQKNRCR